MIWDTKDGEYLHTNKSKTGALRELTKGEYLPGIYQIDLFQGKDDKSINGPYKSTDVRKPHIGDRDTEYSDLEVLQERVFDMSDFDPDLK